jgi:ABC-2 type transport system permease protein
MKKKLLPVWVFARIAIKRSFRDRLALFFIFLFPLIFLFIFGGIFGRNNEVSFRVALINQSSSEFSKQFVQKLEENKAFKIDKAVTTQDK